MPGMHRRSSWIIYFGTILLAAIYIFNQNALAAETEKLKKAPVLIMGDRILDITHALGYAPQALATRCTSKAGEKFGSQSISAGCPGKMFRNKAESFNNFCKENGISHLVMEKAMFFCSSGKQTLAEELGVDKHIKISQVDFSQGIPNAIQETAKILGCPDKGKALAEEYQKRLTSVMADIDKDLVGKRILILYGIYNNRNNKFFLQAEGNIPEEQDIVRDLGMINAARDMAPKKEDMNGMGFMAKRLRKLEKAKPDFIVILGDSFAGQKAIRKWAKTHAQKSKLVPAIQDNAIFTLPTVDDKGTLAYPETLKLWNWALRTEKKKK